MERIFIDRSRGIVEVNLGDGNSHYSVPRTPDASSSSASGSSQLHTILARIATVVGVVSLLGALALAIWDWGTGGSAPPFVSIAAKALSVAFIGSLISLGGINIFSLKGELKALQQKPELIIGCPFVPLSLYGVGHKDSPGNPRVCVKCPLGIVEVAGDLIHNCKVYEQNHQRWIEGRVLSNEV